MVDFKKATKEMKALKKYESVNKATTLKGLADIIRSFADDNGLIQGRTRRFDAEKMALSCEHYNLDNHNTLTREFGIRQQAMMILFYTQTK